MAAAQAAQVPQVAAAGGSAVAAADSETVEAAAPVLDPAKSSQAADARAVQPINFSTAPFASRRSQPGGPALGAKQAPHGGRFDLNLAVDGVKGVRLGMADPAQLTTFVPGDDDSIVSENFADVLEEPATVWEDMTWLEGLSASRLSQCLRRS
jgi:hypothetical protein